MTQQQVFATSLLEHGLLPLLLVVSAHLSAVRGRGCGLFLLTGGRFFLGTLLLFLGVLGSSITCLLFLFFILVLYILNELIDTRELR